MIKLLDCTLRDGGYINDWRFGENAIPDMIQCLEQTGVDILELGFLKNEPYQRDRTVFNEMGQITALISSKRTGTDYAAMIEVFSPVSVESLQPRDESTVDIIRVIVWKDRHDENNNVVDALEEGYEYCRHIVEKGYKLCVQPARVDQYSDVEFVNMLKMFEKLDPMAIYVVDSWGTMQSGDIMHYVRLADQTLKAGIAIGYHGHNNMLQAFGTAVEFVNSGIDRTLIVDGSIYGMGRCAGNLNLEIMARYLNTNFGKAYGLEPMYNIYEEYIKDIYKQHKWGYSIPYFLTAIYGCHPNYAWYLCTERGLESTLLEQVLLRLNKDDKILYSKEKAKKYLGEVLAGLQ